ncbi:MAG: hypothetical protein HeimC3_02630 [Candidatus Heimdallarchaeota archaeon LC_3]|nr:MAG: hypothetical protein HeimC3_02630 [Candidatus Heimdallarchaeota archaeon LC_3]
MALFELYEKKMNNKRFCFTENPLILNVKKRNKFMSQSNDILEVKTSFNLLEIYEEYLFKRNWSLMVIFIGILDVIIEIHLILRRDPYYIFKEVLEDIYVRQAIIFALLLVYSFYFFLIMKKSEVYSGIIMKKIQIQYLIAIIVLWLFKYFFPIWIFPIHDYLPFFHERILYPGLGFILVYFLVKNILKKSGFKELLLTGLGMVILSLFIGFFLFSDPEGLDPFEFLRYENLTAFVSFQYVVAGMIQYWGARKTLG